MSIALGDDRFSTPREPLYMEVEIMAERWRWARNEVLSLPTPERRWYVQRILERVEEEQRQLEEAKRR